MHITRISVQGFKTLRKFDLVLNEHLNIVVGDNETGKSTLLEAINLVMSSQIDGRSIHYELNPYFFNQDMVEEYFVSIRRGENPVPPKILIEAYFDDDNGSDMARLKGTNNSRGENCPGLYLSVVLNEDLSNEFLQYVR
jgi:predicted ATP-binding protein involved in virulence